MLTYEEALRKLRLNTESHVGHIAYADEKLEVEEAALVIRSRGKAEANSYQRSRSEELCDRLDGYLRVLASPTKLRRIEGGVPQVLAEIHGLLDNHESLWVAED